MDRKSILLFSLPVLVSLGVGYFLVGHIVDKPSVKITSIDYEILVYSGKAHQHFTGSVLNDGHVPVSNVKVHVSWIDLYSKEHRKTATLGDMSPYESKSFTIIFDVEDYGWIKFYSQLAEFER